MTVLHLAGTRPAMVPVIQVPWTAMVLLIGLTAEFAEIHWKLAILALPFWPPALWVFRQDHNGLRVLGSWVKTAGLDLRANWFHGTSVETLPLRGRPRFRGIPSDDA